jgi:replicative DNA helicase
MVPSAAGIDYYIEIVLEKYNLRYVIQTCTSLANRAMEPGADLVAIELGALRLKV